MLWYYSARKMTNMEWLRGHKQGHIWNSSGLFDISRLYAESVEKKPCGRHKVEQVVFTAAMGVANCDIENFFFGIYVTNCKLI